MFIVTNRNINRKNFKNGVGDENAFGDGFNEKGPVEVRLARAEKVNSKWRVKLVDEPKKITLRNIPSKKEFFKLRDHLVKSKKNCVFFLHGFNQTFKKNIEKALAMEEKHGVEVIAFSWPSNPGGFKTKEYRVAKRSAAASVPALDATLEKLGRYLQQPFNRSALQKCGVKFSFMAYSLGNYMLQKYAVDASYENETNIFDNVILCQADVDSQGHEKWVDDLVVGKKVYITVNENDWVLKWSDANFQKSRLGRTASNFVSRQSAYFDFTGAPNVGNTHGLFYKKTNPVVKDFFTEVLNGRRGEVVEGIVYEAKDNAYRVST